MKHIGRVIADVVRKIPNVPQNVKDAAKVIEAQGIAYDIAPLPIGEWKAAIDAQPDDIRAEVRAACEAIYRQRQTDAALQARLDSGQDVLIEIRDSGKAA